MFPTFFLLKGANIEYNGLSLLYKEVVEKIANLRIIPHSWSYEINWH